MRASVHACVRACECVCVCVCARARECVCVCGGGGGVQILVFKLIPLVYNAYNAECILVTGLD